MASVHRIEPTAVQPLRIINKIVEEKRHEVTDAITHFSLWHFYTWKSIYSLALYKCSCLQLHPNSLPVSAVVDIRQLLRHEVRVDGRALSLQVEIQNFFVAFH